jgi:hypothetical protein
MCLGVLSTISSCHLCSKNVGKTYQRSMKTIFHDMLNERMDEFLDDILIKSSTREGHP